MLSIRRDKEVVVDAAHSIHIISSKCQLFVELEIGGRSEEEECVG